MSGREIAQLWGLREVQVGDTIGVPPLRTPQREFPPPTLESVVAPRNHDDAQRLRVALEQLAEQDPLINVRQGESDELTVSLYGEVQKEVIEATLAGDFGLDVAFEETTPIYVERPVATGEAVEILHAESNPFFATIGLRVEPAPAESGIAFRLAVEAKDAPLYVYGTLDSFREHMGEYVREALARRPARVEGHGLPRDDDPLYVQRGGRPAVAARADQHRRGLPEADAARVAAGARERRDRGLRADGARQPRSADAVARRGDAGADPPGRDRRRLRRRTASCRRWKQSCRSAVRMSCSASWPGSQAAKASSSRHSPATSLSAATNQSAGSGYERRGNRTSPRNAFPPRTQKASRPPAQSATPVEEKSLFRFEGRGRTRHIDMPARAMSGDSPHLSPPAGRRASRR